MWEEKKTYSMLYEDKYGRGMPVTLFAKSDKDAIDIAKGEAERLQAAQYMVMLRTEKRIF